MWYQSSKNDFILYTKVSEKNDKISINRRHVWNIMSYNH